MKILVIDDDPVTREVLGGVLKRFGDVVFAHNGSEGVVKINEAFTEKVAYDLICLDVMMPQMSGKEALKVIRDIEKRHNVPATKVFIITALTSNLVRKDFLDGDDLLFIEKPFRKDALIAHVKALNID